LSVLTDDDGQPKPPIDDCLWFESGDGRPRRVSDIAIDTEALTALLAGAHKGPLDRAAATNSISCRAVYWPHGKDRLQVDEAVRLLQPAYPPAPIAKENDSELRSELIKVTREQDIRNAIISAGQDGLIQLVHPTLGISNGIVPEPDWFIGPEGFTRFAKTFGIAVVGVEGEQAGLPRSDTTKVNGTEDAAPNKRGPPGKKRAEAAARMIEQIENKTLTELQLRKMKQKELVTMYPEAGRTTLVEAREEALETIRENSGKTPTNDK
jgi:hypothetical protein